MPALVVTGVMGGLITVATGGNKRQ
jgi:hypothetical protein